MEKAISVLIIILILISGCNNNVVDKKLSECIAKKSVLYISGGCVACNKQEKMFGENFIYLNPIDCTKEPEKCRAAGITKVPTWIINGKEFKGVQSIEKIKELTKC